MRVQCGVGERERGGGGGGRVKEGDRQTDRQTGGVRQSARLLVKA